MEAMMIHQDMMMMGGVTSKCVTTERLCDYLRSLQVKQSTRDSYGRALRQFVGYLHDNALQGTRRDVIAFIEWM